MLYRKKEEPKLSEELFQNPTSEYRGTPFWAWNCKVTEEQIDFQTEALKEMASYVKKNGLKIYGFTTIADKDTLLKLSKQGEVYEIYTEELK